MVMAWSYEYPRESALSYAQQFLSTLEADADAIRAHWSTPAIPIGPSASGPTPKACCRAGSWSATFVGRWFLSAPSHNVGAEEADYVHILTPDLGTGADNLGSL